MNSFNKNKIHSTVKSALVLLCGASVVFSVSAQEVIKDKKESIEVIEVTGLRASLTSALNAKKDSDFISDSIIAEEIGKSSDESIAEAISRITGVSLDRNGDDTQTVTVRGVNAALNTVTMNGVTMTSNTDNQAVDLSLFSADVLSRINVIKSPSANQEEGSLGALIELKTVAPLSTKYDVQVFSAEARYNDLSEEITPRFSFNMVEHLQDNIGLSASLFYDQLTVRKDEYQLFSNRIRNLKNTGKTSVTDSSTGEAIDTHAVMPWFLVNRYNLDEKTKFGGTGTFEYRPDEDTDIRFDVAFSRNEIDHTHSTARLHNFKNTNNILTVDSNTGGSYNVDSARSQKIGGLNQSGHWLNTTDTLVTGIQFQRIFDDYWRYSGRLGYSSTDQKFTDGYRTAWVHSGISGANDSWCGYNTDIGPQGDVLLVQNFCSVFNPNVAESMKLAAVRSDIRDVSDEKVSGYFDVERSIDDSFITSVEFGVKYTDRSKHVYAEEVFLNSGSFENTDAIFASDVSSQSAFGGGFLAGIAPSNAISDWLMPDSQQGIDLAFPNGIGPGTNYPFLKNDLKDWQVDELTYGAYVQANFEFLDGDISGNFGVRYAATVIDSYGSFGFKFDKNMPFLIDGNEFVTKAITGENDFDELLPSITVNWALNGEVIVRVAAARVLARANINSLRPGIDVKAQNLNETPQANGGNTMLDPFLADQFDLSVGWYFEEGALLSAALFYKDFVSFSYDTVGIVQMENPLTSQCVVDRSSLDDIDKLTATAPCADMPFSTTVNGGSADIKGLELSYQQNFTALPSLFKYLGTQINYTYADSNAIVNPESPEDAFNNLPFLNTSEHSANITGFWDDDTTSVRLVYAYRSEALSDVSHFNSSIIRYARETLDFAVNYKVNKHLKFTFSATNLTDSYDKFVNAITLSTIDEAGTPLENIVKETLSDLSTVPQSRTHALYNSGRNYRLSLRYTF